jgi:hypothetical protein
MVAFRLAACWALAASGCTVASLVAFAERGLTLGG